MSCLLLLNIRWTKTKLFKLKIKFDYFSNSIHWVKLYAVHIFSSFMNFHNHVIFSFVSSKLIPWRYSHNNYNYAQMHTPPKETCNYTIFVNQSHFNINFKIAIDFIQWAKYKCTNNSCKFKKLLLICSVSKNDEKKNSAHKGLNA